MRRRASCEYASRAVTTIEINGTFYGSQKPASFLKWAEETPDDFVFSMKAPRFAVNRRVLAEAGPSIEKFFDKRRAPSEIEARPDPLAVRAAQEISNPTISRRSSLCSRRRSKD